MLTFCGVTMTDGKCHCPENFLHISLIFTSNRLSRIPLCSSLEFDIRKICCDTYAALEYYSTAVGILVVKITNLVPHRSLESEVEIFVICVIFNIPVEDEQVCWTVLMLNKALCLSVKIHCRGIMVTIHAMELTEFPSKVVLKVR